MTEVVIAEDDGIGSMESNEENSVRSLWKFCNSITLPRSEVVFFTQATLIFILVIASLLKLTLDRPPCEEMSVWFSLLFGAVGYILPNPKLRTKSFSPMIVYSWLWLVLGARVKLVSFIRCLLHLQHFIHPSKKLFTFTRNINRFSKKCLKD